MGLWDKLDEKLRAGVVDVDMDPLSTEQAEGLVEAMLLVAYGNGEFSIGEDLRAVSAMLEVRALQALGASGARELVGRLKTRVQAMSDAEREARIVAVAASMPPGPPREKALRTLLTVALGDNDPEGRQLAVARAFAGALGVPEARTKELLAEVERSML